MPKFKVQSTIMKRLSLLLFLFVSGVSLTAQPSVLVQKAAAFVASLSPEQKLKALYPFDSDERYSFHFFPIEDRKGITLQELTPAQKAAAFDLLKECVSKQTNDKVQAIIQLELVLKEIEHQKPDSHFRDTGRYYIALFGNPANNTTWGWRFEGHHVSFHFSADKNQLVSGTPGFLGSNPGTVQDGPQKGKQVLKEETALGYALLHSLSAMQLTAALIDTLAPADIKTFISKKAILEKQEGIHYAALTDEQKTLFLQLVKLYVYRYTKLFAEKMLKEIQQAGLDNLSFAWAGYTGAPAIGHPQYYRIQGPTLIVEYDNTQNNANHVHTVVRDLNNDFGGDLLLEHYKASH